jgi:hypothetical protein
MAYNEAIKKIAKVTSITCSTGQNEAFLAGVPHYVLDKLDLLEANWWYRHKKDWISVSLDDIEFGVQSSIKNLKTAADTLLTAYGVHHGMGSSMIKKCITRYGARVQETRRLRQIIDPTLGNTRGRETDRGRERQRTTGNNPNGEISRSRSRDRHATTRDTTGGRRMPNPSTSNTTSNTLPAPSTTHTTHNTTTTNTTTTSTNPTNPTNSLNLTTQPLTTSTAVASSKTVVFEYKRANFKGTLLTKDKRITRITRTHKTLIRDIKDFYRYPDPNHPMQLHVVEMINKALRTYVTTNCPDTAFIGRFLDACHDESLKEKLDEKWARQDLKVTEMLDAILDEHVPTFDIERAEALYKGMTPKFQSKRYKLGEIKVEIELRLMKLDRIAHIINYGLTCKKLQVPDDSQMGILVQRQLPEDVIHELLPYSQTFGDMMQNIQTLLKALDYAATNRRNMFVHKRSPMYSSDLLKRTTGRRGKRQRFRGKHSKFDKATRNTTQTVKSHRFKRGKGYKPNYSSRGSYGGNRGFAARRVSRKDTRREFKSKGTGYVQNPNGQQRKPSNGGCYACGGNHFKRDCKHIKNAKLDTNIKNTTVLASIVRVAHANCTDYKTVASVHKPDTNPNYVTERLDKRVKAKLRRE